MGKQVEVEGEEAGEEFKAQIFANNPDLYMHLFEKKEEQPFEEADIYYPESEEELQAMLDEMKREGAF